MSHLCGMNGGLSNSTVQRLMKEIRNLMRKPLEDIEIRLSDNLYGGSGGSSLDSIEAVVHGPEGTPFEAGEFVVRLMFGSDFPNSPPKGYFLTKIFHPNVAPKSGEICVNTLKRDWKPKYGIKHILIAIRSLLIVPNHDSALNQEAGKLLLQSYQEFANRARLYTKIHAASNTMSKQRSTNKNNNESSQQRNHSKSKEDIGNNNNNNNNNTNVSNGMDGMNVDSNSSSSSSDLLNNGNDSEIDAGMTNENEEGSNKPVSKSKSKSVALDEIDTNNNASNNNNNNNGNSQERLELENNGNIDNNVMKWNDNNERKEKRKSKHKNRKDKDKKKSKKDKSKVKLSKSMQRL